MQFDFINVLRHENKTLPNLLELLTRLQDQVVTIPLFSSLNGLLMCRDCLFLDKDSSLKTLLLQEFHETPIGGHASVQEGMKKDVKDYVGQCYTCQTVKYSSEKPYGLLQPTKLLEQLWQDSVMDFIIRLPQSKGAQPY